LYNFRPEFSNHQSPQNLPMPHLLVRSPPFFLPFKDNSFHWHLPFTCYLQRKYW
jgi:hypothetical protein